MPKYGDLEIEWEGGVKRSKIKSAKDHAQGGADITHEFKKAKVDVYDEDGQLLTSGTVIMTKHNPYCYWVCCADGWHYRCVG